MTELEIVNVKQSMDDISTAEPVIAPAPVREIGKHGSGGVAMRDPVIDVPFPVRHAGWLVGLAEMPRRAISALLRPRPDLRALSPHMRRDVGLVDTTPVKRHR
jgi:hypothetical protein